MSDDDFPRLIKQMGLKAVPIRRYSREHPNAADQALIDHLRQGLETEMSAGLKWRRDPESPDTERRSLQRRCPCCMRLGKRRGQAQHLWHEVPATGFREDGVKKGSCNRCGAKITVERVPEQRG